MGTLRAFAVCVARTGGFYSHGASPTCDELIDQLVELSEFTVGLHPTAFVEQFLGADDEPEFGGGIMKSTKPSTNSAMRELVRRGPEAIASVLRHLDDARPTKLVIKEEGHVTWARASNFYNNRPLGIDVSYTIVEEPFDLPYVVKIGDVCLVVLGQISNRPQPVVQYRHTGGVQICSPILRPEIVKAARDDWTDVTREELLQHLWTDARNDEPGGPVDDILQQIRLYFPDRYPDVKAELENARKAE